MGDYFLVFSLTTAVSASPGIFLLRKCLNLSTIMLLGAILAVAGNSLMGLCPLFGIPHKLEFIWIGIVLLGLSLSLLNAPFIPYIVGYYEEHP